MIFAFEGVDGSGKTTLSRLLYEKILGETDYDVLWLSEPTPFPIGGTVRQLVNTQELNTFEQTLLFTADREYMIRNYILPNKDKIIILDRSFVSSYVYQIMNLDDTQTQLKNILITLTEYSIRNFYVDILFYLDCEPKVAWERVKNKEPENVKSIDYYTQMRKNYLEFLRNKHPHIKDIYILNGAREVSQTLLLVKNRILEQATFLLS
ncbi:MAG: dTMP kinase [Candidatus Diapherotrites archaeon]|nr:dTMP kinase [Candidatus Diapherotrites archaeon]